jgi:hypothetical protein
MISLFRGFRGRIICLWCYFNDLKSSLTLKVTLKVILGSNQAFFDGEEQLFRNRIRAEPMCWGSRYMGVRLEIACRQRDGVLLASSVSDLCGIMSTLEKRARRPYSLRARVNSFTQKRLHHDQYIPLTWAARSAQIKQSSEINKTVLITG